VRQDLPTAPLPTTTSLYSCDRDRVGIVNLDGLETETGIVDANVLLGEPFDRRLWMPSSEIVELSKLVAGVPLFCATGDKGSGVGVAVESGRGLGGVGAG